MVDAKRIDVKLEFDNPHVAGYLFGALTAVCFSISPILLRKGLDELPAPLWASFIGLFATALAYIPWFVLQLIRRLQGHRHRMLNHAEKRAVNFQALAGLGAGVGTVARTLSISLAPVVVAVPLTQTSSFFTVLFVLLLLGKDHERITGRLILGSILTVIGSALIVVGNNQ